MNIVHPVVKDKNRELPIPTSWRRPIVQIVSSLINGDTEFRSVTGSVESLSKIDYQRIDDNIKSYGGNLIELPEEVWDTSIYQYQCDRWEALIDLFTDKEGLSDLALFLDVIETPNGYHFIISDIHVP